MYIFLLVHSKDPLLRRNVCCWLHIVFGCWGNGGVPMKVTVPNDNCLLSRTKTNLTVPIPRTK